MNLEDEVLLHLTRREDNGLTECRYLGKLAQRVPSLDHEKITGGKDRGCRMS